MKSVAITDANRALADYAREALAVSTNPDFIALIARARARFQETGGISLEEMKRRWGGKQSLRKPSRRAAARRARSRRGRAPAR